MIIEGFKVFDCIARSRAKLMERFGDDTEALHAYLIESSDKAAAEYIARGGTVAEEQY